MKKVIKSTLSILLLLAPTQTLAQTAECPGALGTFLCTSSLQKLITSISNIILLLVGVVAVLFLIIGGFQYISSAGNPETIQKAKTTILYAIIGILVTLIAYAAVNFVIGQMMPTPSA